MFGKSLGELSGEARNGVHLQVIDSAGRSRPSVNLALQRFSKLGRVDGGDPGH
jgi:hypothetical protein